MKQKHIQAVRSRGFTALELVIVLIVGFMIIALSASRLGELFSAASTTRAADTILSLYTATRSLEFQGKYPSNILTELRDADMLPPGIIIAGNKFLNEWNQEIKVEAPDPNDATKGFTITYGGVPKEPCVKLTQEFLGSGNFPTITVGSTGLTIGSDMAAIITACKTAPATIVFSTVSAANAPSH